MNVKDMTFLEYWKESLSLIFSKHIKLLVFATAKQIGPVYRTLIYYFWWLFGLCMLLDLTIRFKWYLHWTIHEIVWSVALSTLWFIAWTLLATGVFLVIRPSVHKKELGYFLSYKKQYLCFFLITLIARSIFEINWPLLVFSKLKLNFITWVYVVLSLLFFIIPHGFEITTLYFSPFFIFLALFLFDTQHCFRDLGLIFKRAIKMVFYNYPACLALFFISILLDALLLGFILRPLILCCFHLLAIPVDKYLIFYIAENSTKLFMPFSLCFMANVYTLLVHNQADLYFK